MLTGPSPLLLQWRRRLRLQVNEAWPLIDHVWSCTTLLISACSSLVCLFSSTVPIITPLISYIMCALHACALTTSTQLLSLQRHQVLSLTFPPDPQFFFFSHSVVPFLRFSFSIPLSGSCLGSDSLTPAGAGGMQQLSYTTLINNTWQKYERAGARAREGDWKFPLAGEQGVAHGQMLAFSRRTCSE